MIRVAILATCLTFAPQVFAQSVSDFTEANTRADVQEKSEATDTYANAWADFNNLNHLDERDGCYFKAEGELTQVLEIDAAGRVIGYYADRDNGRSQCWRATYLGVVFPWPPFAPYWHKLLMH